MDYPLIAQCLEVLRCPITGQALSVLTQGEIEACNRRCGTGALLHRDGTRVPTALHFALGTPGRTEVYRVDDSIIWLLSDLALVDAAGAGAADVTGDRKVVQEFYDQYGWVKAAEGLYHDTTDFTDTRSVARDYQRLCNARIGRELRGGRYLLDVASGAIPHPEYLDFSRNTGVRICVDFSVRALREAHAKLGDSGIYVLGDITRLPLASNAIDEVISLHTVYHVPRAEQTAAVLELVRVARPGGRIIVVYTWANSAAMKLCFLATRRLGRIRSAFGIGKRRAPAAGPAPDGDRPPLYFSPQDHDWFTRELAPIPGTRLRVWSAVSTPFQARFFTAGPAGRLIVALLRRLEDWFPALAGRYGQYPMFVIDKPGG